MHLNSACVARIPRSQLLLLPMFAVRRIPHVIAIAIGPDLSGVARHPSVPAQHPEPPQRGIVIRARQAREPSRPLDDRSIYDSLPSRYGSQEFLNFSRPKVIHLFFGNN